MAAHLTRWVLVAGTGKQDLPAEVNWTARAVGSRIARAGYGLVVGGWHGVDYVTAEAFSQELVQARKPLSSYLIQVVPTGSQPQFKGGHVVYVAPGLKEFLESVKYADAVILLGGLGGTYETYQFAAQEQRPVFPLAGTGGDARRALEDLMSHWGVLPMAGVDQETARSVLGRAISSEGEALRAAVDVLGLIADYFGFTSPEKQQERTLVFISYSHRDREWLEKLRTMLRPLERNRKITVWADTAINVGQRWLDEIRGALRSTKVALFLVSPAFLASDFCTTEELPTLLDEANKNHVRIFWLLLSAGLYEETKLSAYQAAHDLSAPLDTLSPAKQNEILVEVCREIAAVATT